MKTNRIILLLFLPAFLIFAAGCKKDKTIHKNLWDNGGKWLIEELVIVFDTYEDAEIIDTRTETYQQVGYLLFRKDGTVDLVEYDYDESITYNYENTEATLTFSQGNVDIICGMDWEKDQISIRFPYIDEDLPENVEAIQYMELRKDK